MIYGKKASFWLEVAKKQTKQNKTKINKQTNKQNKNESKFIFVILFKENDVPFIYSKN